MRKNIYTLISLIAVLAIAACSKSGNQEKIIAVEKEFSFQPWELLSESGSTLSLISNTIEPQKCGGTKVKIEVKIDPRGVIVNVNGLTYPSLCDNISLKATDTSRIEGLKKGSYSFKINLKNAIVNDGSLTIEDNKYTLSMNKLDGIEVPISEIMRVPKGLIWGYVSYELPQEANYTKFIDKLKKIASPQNDIPKGDYGYFTMGDQSKFNVKVKIDQPKNKTEHLVYYLNSNSSNLKDLVEEFRNAAFEVKFYTSDGKAF